MKGKSGIFLCSLCVAGALFAFSCRQKSQAASFIGSLDFTDSLIASGQVKDAWAILEKMTKQAKSPEQRLSVIKRYIQTGAYDTAETLLQKALKSFPSDQRLRAVYVHLLLTRENYAKACAVGESLLTTQFGSLLTEAKIKNTNDRKAFYQLNFVQHYMDAAAGSGDTAFLRNAAFIFAREKRFADAAALHPVSLQYYEQPYFWALIAYDSGNFAKSIADLDLLDLGAKEISLRSDIYLRSEMCPEAASQWKVLMENFPGYSPIPYYNSALYELENGNTQSQSDFLFALVHKFPLYLPGLFQYSQLALKTSRQIDEDLLSKALRAADMSSLKMKMQDALPKIPVTDALNRMQNAFDKSGDERLIIEIQKLQWQAEKKPLPERTRDLWLLLESFPENEYLHRYALWHFLKINDKEEAWKLLNRHIQRKYASTDFFALAPSLEGWEKEYIAYLWASEVPSSEYPNYEVPIALYNEILEKEPENTGVHLNLACLYASNGNTKAAFEQYTAAANFSKTPEHKSEIHYQSAVLYASKKDYRNALLSLNYALSANPENSKARLLQKKIQQQ